MFRPQGPSLSEVINGDQSDYVLQTCYGLVRFHGNLCFPAVITGTKQPVITPNEDVLGKILGYLRSCFWGRTAMLLYVNQRLNHAFPLQTISDRPAALSKDLEKRMALPIITQDEFDRLATNNSQAFSWSPFLSPDMSPDETAENLINFLCSA